MTLLDVFRKFVGFRALEFFLLNPSKDIHLKELARELEVSPRSVKIYCDLFEEECIVTAERNGNLRIFRLNRESFIVKELIRTYHLLILKDAEIGKLCSEYSIAIYGSEASRDRRKSDLDILIIGDESRINYNLLRKMEEKIGRNVQLTIIPFHRWKIMKGERDEFAESVIRKHVLIRGVPL